MFSSTVHIALLSQWYSAFSVTLYTLILKKLFRRLPNIYLNQLWSHYYN